MILIGHVIDSLKTLKAGSVHCCVTSPPYWNLRNYQVDGQIGAEPTIDGYVQSLVNVFREVRRALRDDGLLWLNLGDSYNTTDKWGGGGSNTGKQTVAAGGRVPSWEATRTKRPKMDGIKVGEVCNIPNRVATALQADGWWWRSTVCWSKPSAMTESVAGWRWMKCKCGSECKKCSTNGGLILRLGRWRCTNSWESIFMFSKSRMYFCDQEAVLEPAVGGAKGSRFDKGKTAERDGGDRTQEGYRDSETRNPRSVWSIPPQNYTGAHFATFPPMLPYRCIKASVSAGGCCSACGRQYAPIVEKERKATRPGNNSKVGRASDDADSPYHKQNGSVVGNRDPQRHIKISRVLGYLPTCKCNAPVGKPHVLDCFGGSGTTAAVAEYLGCDWTLCELNPEYAKLAEERIAAGWKPKEKRVAKSKRRKRQANQKELQF